MAARSEGVSVVVRTGRHILGGGKERGGRGNNRLGAGVGFGFRRSGIEWSEWVE